MEINEFWGPEYPPIDSHPSSPSEQRVRQWEQRYGVRLPETLGKALSVQDGGSVRGTELIIFPISEITPLSGEEWDRFFESSDRGIGERTKLFRFGAEDVSQASIILDYNAGTEPRISWLGHDGDDELHEMEGTRSFDDLIRFMRRRQSRS